MDLLSQLAVTILAAQRGQGSHTDREALRVIRNWIKKHMTPPPPFEIGTVSGQGRSTAHVRLAGDSYDYLVLRAFTTGVVGDPDGPVEGQAVLKIMHNKRRYVLSIVADPGP